MPDLCLPVGRGGYFGLYIELKVGRNKTSEKQDEWIEELEKENYKVNVCYGWRNAAEVIKEYLGKGKTNQSKER